MLRQLVLFLLLYVTWIVFSGYFTPFFLILGAISSAVAVWVSSRMDRLDGKQTPFPTDGLLRLPGYLLWLAKEVALSSIQVTRKVWQAEIDISPSMAWVPASQRKDFGLATYANSITLTPGTVAVDVANGQIQVHALEQSSLDDLMKGEMDRRVTILSEGHADA